MAQPLVPGDAQSLLEAWKRAWERRDVDAALALFREDAEMRTDPFGEPVVGAMAIRAWWNALVAGNVHLELDAERTWVSGRTVLAAWHGARTDRTNADRIRIRGFLVLDLDDAGRISRLRGWPLERIVGKDSTVRPEPGGPDAEVA